MAGRRIIYLASLIGCLVFYYFYREWLSWLFLMAILFLPWLSLIFSLPAMITARGKLDFPDTVPVGQKLHAAMDLTAKLPVPSFRYKLRVTNTITGTRRKIKPGKPLPTDVCGRLIVEPVKTGVCDYLGLFRLPLGKRNQATVYIWPVVTPLAYEPDFARRPPRRWKPKPGGGFAENHELRLYRPGDSLQQIHWKLSAKTGNLILREAMEPVYQLLRLTLDLNGTPEELNRKLGRLLWLGQLLVEKEHPFHISALTGRGVLSWQVDSADALNSAMAELLSTPAAESGTLKDAHTFPGRAYHIGGGVNEE